MRIRDMNWMQVEKYLEEDDRAVVPLGSTEQHGYLSLFVDAILPERLAAEAAEPLGVPVFPVVPYGVAPYFMAFPGTVTLRIDTYLRVIEDILDSLARSGFRRILLLNGHGGNAPAASLAMEWMPQNEGVHVKVYDWWSAPRTWQKVQEIDNMASHASWMENFPWTRLEGVVLPKRQKQMVDSTMKMKMSAAEFRKYVGDGNFGGFYERSDEEMLTLWEVAVADVRFQLEYEWE